MILRKEAFIKMVMVILGILLLGTGVAFNAAAVLGNDPIGILYDGIRNITKLSPDQLGMASNIVNISVVILVFVLNRHYVNIGTFIYILPYGTIVDMGRKIYFLIFMEQTLPNRIIGAGLGCILIYLGVALFITADIGLDPMTGIVMVIRDKLKKEYKKVKVCFDIMCIFIGFIFGGKLGVITIVTAVMAGPIIQFFSDYFKKKLIQLKCINE
jgi:uncharacterized membrane protein YczE